jgi:hypothetical protein
MRENMMLMVVNYVKMLVVVLLRRAPRILPLLVSSLLSSRLSSDCDQTFLVAILRPEMMI